jgi:hypothetical protein
VQQPTGIILRHRFSNYGSEIFTGFMSSQDILALPGKKQICMVLMSENCFGTDAQKGKGKVTPKQAYMALRGPGG